MSWGDNVHWNFHTYVMLRPPFFLPFRTNIMLRRCTFLAFTNASCYAAACIFYRTSTRASWYALYVFFATHMSCHVAVHYGVLVRFHIAVMLSRCSHSRYFNSIGVPCYAAVRVFCVFTQTSRHSAVHFSTSTNTSCYAAACFLAFRLVLDSWPCWGNNFSKANEHAPIIKTKIA